MVAGPYPLHGHAESSVGSEDAASRAPDRLAPLARAARDSIIAITPKVPIVGGNGIAPAPAGLPATYSLERGQVLLLTQPEELTGSRVQSNKPISVWGGHGCLQIPADVGYCDGSHQQLPPIHALGTEYVGLRYRNRYDGVEESPPWRLVGAADGTTLSWDPAPPAGAPVTLAAQQVAEFSAPGPFVVKSQDADHPFYLGAYMTGCLAYGTDKDCRGLRYAVRKLCLSGRDWACGDQ